MPKINAGHAGNMRMACALLCCVNCDTISEKAHGNRKLQHRLIRGRVNQEKEEYMRTGGNSGNNSKRPGMPSKEISKSGASRHEYGS